MGKGIEAEGDSKGTSLNRFYVGTWENLQECLSFKGQLSNRYMDYIVNKFEQFFG